MKELFHSKRRNQEGNTIPFYFQGAGFESWPRDWLYLLSFSVIFLSPFEQVPLQYYNMTSSFASFQINNHPIDELIWLTETIINIR
jgi:hypothetical protein